MYLQRDAAAGSTCRMDVSGFGLPSIGYVSSTYVAGRVQGLAPTMLSLIFFKDYAFSPACCSGDYTAGQRAQFAKSLQSLKILNLKPCYIE